MRAKETEEIGINLVHISDLIDVLTNDIHYIPSGDRQIILKGQINIATMAVNNILKIIVK